MDKNKTKKTIITIVGGGTAGWITAAIMTKGLDLNTFTINLVESPDIPTVGVGEATIPPIIQLLQFLEINEADLLSKISGTFKFGIHFENWSNIGDSYMHAFGPLGTNFQNLTFTEAWLKCKHQLNLPPLNNFSSTAVASYNSKFSHCWAKPKDAQNSHYFPLSNLFHAYQFDAALLADYLKEYAIKRGVNFISDTVANVYQDNNGNVEKLALKNFGLLTGDYFVDCSGARSTINKQTLKSEFTSWKKYLPCDSALVVQTKATESPLPYTKSIAMDSGWRWQIPLQMRNGNGYVYASDFTSFEEVEKEFEKALAGQTKINEPRTIKFETGCLSKPWDKNCIAIGLSSGFLEPLESTSIHMTHKFAIKLMGCFKHGTDMQKEADDFNHAFRTDSIAIRDFLILHYTATKREDSAFWRHCKNIEKPEALQNYLSQYQETGHISLPKDNIFPYESWLQVLVGQNYLTDYSRFRDESIDFKQAGVFFNNVEKAINSEVSRLIDHKSYLTDYLSQVRNS